MLNSPYLQQYRFDKVITQIILACKRMITSCANRIIFKAVVESSYLHRAVIDKRKIKKSLKWDDLDLIVFPQIYNAI